MIPVPPFVVVASEIPRKNPDKGVLEDACRRALEGLPHGPWTVQIALARYDSWWVVKLRNTQSYRSILVEEPQQNPQDLYRNLHRAAAELV